ncbi:hypothetical protein JR316_0011874 [Psilocybe cubensis]|uniref:Uncharacterized protein n=2 Tax=Psilocybe cubensis TaxID=181762 RepID=A0ACB8GMP9_PSICU|nr:hypothetical protein JR316_0011874 [Psilocybe cubensis]KAH9476300.1 hypothetical protein JR316_0011874 [Psilocybe cubensis]
MTATTTNESGGPGLLRLRMKRLLNVLCQRWLYIGIAIFLATLNLLLGILTLSYLHPKKDVLLFGIVCFAIILALGHFASCIYLIQRAKDESSDPTLVDAACSAGVVALFALSGVVLTIKLKGRCFSGHNEMFTAIGQGCCNGVTAMAAISWIGVVIMIIASVIILIAALRAIEEAKQPPPVFPSGAEAPVMRWLDRNDPFLAVTERRQQYV